MNTTVSTEFHPPDRQRAWARGFARLSPVMMVLVCTTGCEGLQGTIAVDIVTAPGGSVMDPVVRARLTLSEPFAQVESERAADGTFALTLDVEAPGVSGSVAFEGFDQSGSLVAYGRTPPLPIAAFDTNVSIYVARPMSIAPAPVGMEAARSDMGVTALSYGVAMAGGRRTSGEASARMDIYNAYSHAFQLGEDMPEARVQVTATTGIGGDVYLFGGVDELGQPSANTWRFSTSIPPAGAYTSLSTDSALARAGARTAVHSSEMFVITGEPPVLINGISSTVDVYADAPALHGTATTVFVDNRFRALFVGSGNGDGGGYMLEDDAFTPLDHPGLRRTDHESVALPGERVLTIAGALSDTGVLDDAGMVVDMRSRAITEHSGLLDTPRTAAAVAASAVFVLIAGGVDAAGELIADAEILDAVTLEPVTVLPLLVPRRAANAAALANGQILLVGGVDEDGDPIGTIELFTPRP